jgi:tetratricopeptide (TPR) repeat protein
MTILAWAYSTGSNLGVEEDKEKALKLYEEAAALQDPDAQVILAGAYEDGDFGEVDKAKALGLYILAAGNGDPDALLRLAKAHSPGGDLGVEVDDAKAIELFKEVAALDGGEVNLDSLGVDSLEVMELFKEAFCRHAALVGGKVKFAEENDGKGIMHHSATIYKTTAKGSCTIAP